MHRVVLLIATALSSPAAANTTGCGENAFTFAEVVEARPGERHRGSIVSVPDSLCADLVEDRKPSIGALNLLIGEPSATPRGSPGGRGGRVPALARSADLSECDPRRESAGFPGTACEPGVTNVTTVSKVCAIGSGPAAFARFGMPAAFPHEAPHGRLIIRDTFVERVSEGCFRPTSWTIRDIVNAMI